MISHSLQPEARLLLLTAGPARNDAQVAKLVAEKGLDWDLLAALTTRSKAAPIVWQRIEPLLRGGTMQPGGNKLQKQAIVNEFRHSVLEQCFHEVILLLQDNGIRPVLLKGAALALTTYSSFRDRPMGDLDLLVERDQAQSAQQLLLDAGWKEEFPAGSDSGGEVWRDEFYRGHHHLPALVDPRGASFALEVHTDVFPPYSPFRLNGERIRERARRVEFRGLQVAVPDPIDQLQHLCLHFAWSHMLRSGAWRTFRDLQSIIDAHEVDWTEFIRAARASRGSTCCYWTLRLARSLAGVEVPEDVLAALEPSLPAALAMRLEYHFTHELLPRESMCPSVRLRQALWSTAIQPRRSGHNGSRPWHHIGQFTALNGGTSPGGARKLWGHVRDLGRWTAYLAAMVLPPASTHSAFPATRRI